MADAAAASPWNADAINHGWSLWRELVEADDPKRAVAALKRDDLRCIVLAQLLEQRQGRELGATGLEPMTPSLSSRTRTFPPLRSVGE